MTSIPPAAKARTPEGAAAFVKFYMQQVNVAWTTPRTGLLPPLSESGCLSCKAFEKTSQELVRKRQRYAHSPATLAEVKPFDGAPTGRQYVRIIGTQREVDIVDADGAIVKTDAEKKLALSAMTIWKGDRWLLYDMG